MPGETIFAFPIGSDAGWAIRGLNTALSWPGVAVSSMPPHPVELPPDDPRWALLRERLTQSQRFQQYLGTCNESGIIDAPVLVALGNDLLAQRSAYGRVFKGKPTIACPVFEDVAQIERNVGNLKEYDAVVVASRWNQEVLEGVGVKSTVVHEGVDPIIFNPSVRKPRNDGKFRVFSGGKAEYRKGQDIVIEAFTQFAEKHDDAVLVAAWGSPFGRSGQDFEGKCEIGGVPGAHIGRPNFHAWLQRAGLKPHQFEIVEPRPNWRMAEIYAGCDVAVFPNRCEGGTNFPAMEAIACGVPTFIRLGYGQDDLIGTGEAMNYIGSDADVIEEMVFWLEEDAYEGDVRGLTMQGTYWTWDRHCREMAAVIANV